MISLNVKTEQEAFDLAVERLSAQGFGSYDAETLKCLYDGSALYPAGGNVACAIGHMIDNLADRHYLDVRDAPGASGIVVLLDDGVVNANGIDPDFLDQLQECHDYAATHNPGQEDRAGFLGFFYRGMKLLADKYPDDIQCRKTLDAAVKKAYIEAKAKK